MNIKTISATPVPKTSPLTYPCAMRYVSTTDDDLLVVLFVDETHGIALAAKNETHTQRITTWVKATDARWQPFVGQLTLQFEA